MHKVLGIVALSGMMLGSLATSAPAVMAEEITCSGAIGAKTVDNLRVPQNGSCTLNGTIVEGTIKVERGASLDARGVQVNGNVQGENHRYISVSQNSRINGNIQFDQGGGFQVLNSRAQGIQVKANNGSSLLQNNRVKADIQVFSHSGGIKITQNYVDGNLQCIENSPAPTGGKNVVQGNKEDQCRKL